MGYVAIKSEPELWTVGHYGPGGKWNSESDHQTYQQAAARLSYLNGGGGLPELIDLRVATNELIEEVDRVLGAHLLREHRRRLIDAAKAARQACGDVGS